MILHHILQLFHRFSHVFRRFLSIPGPPGPPHLHRAGRWRLAGAARATRLDVARAGRSGPRRPRRGDLGDHVLPMLGAKIGRGWGWLGGDRGDGGDGGDGNGEMICLIHVDTESGSSML